MKKLYKGVSDIRSMWYHHPCTVEITCMHCHTHSMYIYGNPFNMHNLIGPIYTKIWKCGHKVHRVTSQIILVLEYRQQLFVFCKLYILQSV